MVRISKSDREVNLLPCPFCGSNDYRVDFREETLGCVCGVELTGFKDFASAETHWNTRASSWQPIETAPKDGEEVLGYAEGAITLMAFNEDWNGDMMWQYFNGRDWYPTRYEPTHWMPLPEPPK